AGRLHGERLQDTDALDIAVNRAKDWFRDNAERAEQLRTFSGQQTGRGAAGVNCDRWTADAEMMLRPDYRPAFTGSSPIPGAATTMTYDATVLRFEEVQSARADWESKKVSLQRVLDLCAALGLATAGDKRPQALVIPRSFSLSQARERRNELELVYPHYKRDFVFENVPEAIQPAVNQAAHTNYEHMLVPAQSALLKQLEQAGGGGEETRVRWESVRNWLRDPKELEDWR